MVNQYKISAPGRICLFGEHQDYLQLSVIPAAINIRCYIEGIPNNSGKILLNDEGFDKMIEIPFHSKFLKTPHILGSDDYFKAVCNVFMKKGYFRNLKQKFGFKGRLWNEIPQQSGLSSSAAILVVFAKLIDIILQLDLDEKEIAHCAYLAEHNEMGIPCGQMDQLSVSLGGIFQMKCITPPIINKIDYNIPGLVVGNTLIPKSTNTVHSVRVNEIEEAINFLNTKIKFDIYKTTFEEVEDYLSSKNEIWLKRIRATLKNRDITAEAIKELRKSDPDLKYIGALLNEHQDYLRDDFEVSVEKIDRMIDAGIKAGAFGGKLTGAGMGGSVIMLAPENQKKVVKALTKAGGLGFSVNIDEGLRFETKSQFL